MGLKADEKLCPQCAEPIKKAALVCKHCGYTFTESEIHAQRTSDAKAAKAGGIGCLAIIAVLVLVGMCSSMGGPTPAERAAEDTAANAEEADKKRRGFHCLSAWDGSHRELSDAVKRNLRDPRSYEHIETRITPADENGNHVLMMQYRARNGFGGMNVGEVAATVKNSDCSFEIVASSN